MNKSFLYKAAAVLSALVLWHIASVVVDSSMLLASPLQVAKRLCTIWTENGFVSTVAFSFLRIVGGFLIAFFVGITAAVIAGKFRFIETMLRPYVVTIKTVPIASFIIICLLWFSYSRLTVFICFLIAFPVIYMNTLEGIKNTDKDMLEMAYVYDVPWHRRAMYIYAASVRPYLTSSCSVAIGMAWKAGVAAEVIGNVNGSIGEKLYDAKIYFQNADLLAWTVIIVLLSALSEKGFVFLLKKIFNRIERV